MTNKLSILVLCGGQSTEHAISILSAKNVIERLDTQKYNVSVVTIEQNGTWLYCKSPEDYFAHTNAHAMHLFPGANPPFYTGDKPISIDCVFPVLHGTCGEDGTLQGLLELLNVPYVGADCLGSAIGMDKEISKRLLAAANLPVVDRLLINKANLHLTRYADIAKTLGNTVFVKPNSLGSAVGVKKAMDETTFYSALQDAFRYDEFVLVEKAMMGREIECSVLGNENPRCSLPGEIINHTDFYSYDAKYIDGAAATVKTPADLSPALVAEFQTLAIKAYQTLRCMGMARVDFFLDKNNKIYINEINTIPGFTNISMYPKNWEASGLSYPALLDELIQLAMERHAFKSTLERVYRTQPPISRMSADAAGANVLNENE